MSCSTGEGKAANGSGSAWVSQFMFHKTLVFHSLCDNDDTYI